MEFLSPAGREEYGGWAGIATQSLLVCKVLWSVCRLEEFPDMRQNERTEFIRVGNIVRRAGWLKEESMPFVG